VLDRLFGRDRASEIEAAHVRLGCDQLARLTLIEATREDPTPHRAPIADVADERTCVDAADRRDAVVREPVEPPAGPVGAPGGGIVDGLAHDHCAGVHAARLHRFRAHPVVADHRVGEGDDLAVVRGIRDRLLVAGHCRVEHDLAAGGRLRGHALAVEAGSVLEQDECAWSRRGAHLRPRR
jgi:hypothetical protein